MALRRPQRRSLQAVLAGLAGIAPLATASAAFAAGTPSGFPGRYSNPFGSVTIKQTATGFEVEISTVEPKRGTWVCDFSESGRLAGGQIVIDYRPELAPKDSAPVKVTLTLNNNLLTVSEQRGEQTADYCGFNGFIGGDYRRKAKR